MMLSLKQPRFFRPALRRNVVRYSLPIGPNIPHMRVVEVAAGRSAFLGLLLTAVIGNCTGTSMIQQYTAVPYLSWAVVGAMFASVVPRFMEGGMTEEDAKLEINSGRSAMVVITLLFLFDRFFIHYT